MNDNPLSTKVSTIIFITGTMLVVAIAWWLSVWLDV